MTKNSTITTAINTVRLLSADAVQQANSGHPGLPMGAADMAFTLWNEHMRHNPDNPNWLGRDRFVLSAGHGSSLLYSLLHLFGYDMSREDLRQFRQLDSNTPGHPEHGHTPGVEVTTGPLASGFATGVGLAMAAKQLASRMENEELFDQYVFVLSSDGCLMEGTSHEAASLAGHQKLDNLICFYDSNSITIEGDTSIAFSENVSLRFQAYNWHVISVDGHNVEQISTAIGDAKKQDKPTLIICKTTIGFGSPAKAGTPDAHGAPLGGEELAATKKALGFPANKFFYVPKKVEEYCLQRKSELIAQADAWDEKFQQFLQDNPDKKNLLSILQQKMIPQNLLDELLKVVPEKSMATRASGGVIMNRVAELVPAFCGGSADLNPSTKTYLKGGGDVSATNRGGRNFFYGIRELAMGLCSNGLALYGTTIPFSSTFTVFCDYMKPAIRLAAIQNLHQIYVFTHDSISVGEDGATHQPIEHLTMLRSIPNVTVIRPAEANETAHAWAAAMQASNPVALFLTRQNLENFSAKQIAKIKLARGAYIIDEDANFEYLIIATGSEVNLALETARTMRIVGKKIRVVSMPSWELFDKQTAQYKESILPLSCQKRVSLEVGSTFGWTKYTGCQGLNIGLDHFGDSAPFKQLLIKYGFTASDLAKRIENHFA